MAAHGLVRTISRTEMTAPMKRCVELAFQGYTHLQIAREVFAKEIDKAVANGKDRHNAEEYYRAMRVAKWLERPDCVDYYRKILLQMEAPRYVGKALHVLAKQLDSENEWIANKAANDLLNKFHDHVLGTNSNTVTIQFEGLPELGSPDAVDTMPSGIETEDVGRSKRIRDVVQEGEGDVT